MLQKDNCELSIIHVALICVA